MIVNHSTVMVNGGAKVFCDIDQVLSELSDVVNKSNEENSDHSVAAYIELTDKGKIKWNGPYEVLQKLMLKLTGEDVPWSSPGGECRKLELKEPEVRWYTGTKSLTVNGTKQEDIKSQLRVLSTLANSSSDGMMELDYGEVSEDGLAKSQNVEPAGSEMLANVVRDLEERVNGELANFRSEIQDLKLNFLPDKTTRENGNIDDSDRNHSSLAMREFLLKENACLKERNEKLNRDLNNYICISSDLNMRIKELENQNSSLTTVINLLNNEERNDDNKELWKTAGKKKRSRVACSNNNTQFIKNNGYEVRTDNRYSTLCKRGNNNSDEDVNTDAAAETQEQPTCNPGDKSIQIVNHVDSNDEVREENEQQNLGNGNDTDISQQPGSGHQSNTNSKTAARLRESNKATPSDGSQESKQGIVIIGDSIVKHINPTKLSKKKVHKFTYPGKTASGINNELSSINIDTTPLSYT